MDPRSWSEVRQLFHELVDLGPDRQAERLAAIGAASPALRDSVAALLGSDEIADDRLGALESALMPGATPVPDPFCLSGSTVAHFHVIEPLGAGGMGVVYSAEDLRLHRPVALKVPLPALLQDASAKRRFLHKARCAAVLDHRNLCSILEVGETDDGRCFLAMPLYDGETLKARLARERQLPVETIVDIARQVAEGLSAAHAAEILHRDIKPANVMLLPDGEVKILDFGLAKIRDVTISETRQQLGTVAYMAPEQVRHRSSDPRSDLWALGVMLYEMLTGRRPFDGEDAVAVAHAIVHEDPPPPSTLRDEIPDALEELVCALLQKEPVRRPGSSAQVVTALSALQATSAPRPRRARRQPWRTTTSRSTRRRRRMAGTLLASVAIAGVPFGALMVHVSGSRGMTAAPASVAPAVSPAVPPRSSIAALPFVNLSADGEHGYIAAGLHAELLNRLGQIPPLTVISRSSVLSYDSTTPLARIAAELRVGSVLEGTVHVREGRLLVNVQLIDAETGAHVWANRYDRPLEDAFEVQGDIAQQVAYAVGAAIADRESRGCSFCWVWHSAWPSCMVQRCCSGDR